MNRSLKATLPVIAFLNFVCCHAQVTVHPGNSVQDAINKAAPHDRVLIKKGDYKEWGIEIRKPVNIVGEDYPVIDAGGQGEIMTVFADSVTIEGLAFRNTGVSFLKEHAALRLNEVSNANIRNNRITNAFFGIYLQYSSKCTLSGNYIRGDVVDEARAGNAIHIWKGDSINVLNNITASHRDGIYFEFVSNSVISGNESRDNIRYGLHFMFSNDDVYSENVFRNNGAGVAVMFSKRIRMTRNTFEDNRGGSSYGILLKEISRGEMDHNVFRRNTIGIYAEGATAIDIHHNDFESNGKAIDIKGNSIDNKIIFNNFYANTFEVYTNTRSNHNHYDHNYWSQYNAYDLDDDGIADEAYRPVNLMALITNKVPGAYILLHSYVARSLDLMERIFPQLIPETLIDEHPRMTPVEHD